MKSSVDAFGIIFNLTMGLWNIFLWTSSFPSDIFMWFIPIGIGVGACQVALAIYIILRNFEKIILQHSNVNVVMKK